MNYAREDLILYRLNRAKESLQEAKLLAQAQHWNTVINRLYYSVFYAVSSYLISIDKHPGSHSGTKTLFHQELIKPGKISLEQGKLYNNLFNKRHESDYGDFLVFSREQTEPLIDQVEEFVKIIEVIVFK